MTGTWRCLASALAALAAYRDAAASERRGLLAEARSAARGFHLAARSAGQVRLVEAQCLAREGRADAALGLLRTTRADLEARQSV